MKFEKRHQKIDKSFDKFLVDLDLLRRGSNPDKRISEQKLAKPRDSWIEKRVMN